MHILAAFALWIILVVRALGNSDPCVNFEETRVCNQTQYELYRQCVEETKALRQKRELLCPQIYVVSQPYHSLPVAVKVNKTLELPRYVSDVESNDLPPYIPTNAQLKSLRRKVIVQGEDDDEFHEYQVPTNITTVIRLTNVINNTNVVNVPTNINTTNVNNIHLYANITEGESAPAEENCCTVVRPKTCHASTQGIKCHHKKFRTCGPQCMSKIVHVQRRKRCDEHGNCKDKIAYVPQPEKPKCVYTDQWPFIACGKLANMKVVCDGCYDHYGHGYEAYNGPIADYCRGCYDDGFEYGPLYRRGPVLRPFYYHEPPCYITGTCPSAYEDCGYGCYGHDMIDPVWGPSSPFDPNINDTNTVYYKPELQFTNDTEADWGVPVHKCTVITDDNRISVQNCTNAVDNRYAAAPSNYPYYKTVEFPPQRDKKPPYKVRQTSREQDNLSDIYDEYPSSGDGAFAVNSTATFIVEDDDEYNFN